MKKAFGQTARNLKREVNKTVLKVPKIEQKVLDATSNETWGPHGSQLAEIAQATKNYNECQIAMAVLWKRINGTGKKWRHVYKALAVLEYLVAHGSERVIVEIREHVYQISTLSDFQYIDSNGRDHGSNVRKKAQSLVSLVNDRERIQEIRQKADTNKDRPSDRYNGDRYENRYGNRDDDRNGYGREREWAHRDDDRYGRGRDSYSQGEDHYGRDSDGRYSKDGCRDNDNKASGSNGDYRLASRDNSSGREKDHPYEYDDQYSSRILEQSRMQQNNGPPPSYEDATNDARSHSQEERDGELVAAAPSPKASSPSGNTSEGQATTVTDKASSSPNKEVNAFNGFDPHTSRSAASSTPNTTEMDLLGAFSDSFSISPNSLALVPAVSASEPVEPTKNDFGSNSVSFSSVSTMEIQPGQNPFGDCSPFVAVPFQDNFTAQLQNYASTTSLQPPSSVGSEPHQLATVKVETVPSFDFGDTFQAFPNAPGASTTPLQLPPPTTPTHPPSDAVPFGDNFTIMAPNFAPSQPSTMTLGLEPHQLATTTFDFGDTLQGLTNVPPGVTNVQFPFSAVPSGDNFTAQPHNATSSQHLTVTVGSEPHETAAAKAESVPVPPFGFGETFQSLTYAPPGATNVQFPTASPMHPPFNAENNFISQPQNLQSPTTTIGSEPHQLASPRVETVPAFNFGDTFQGFTYAPAINNVQLPPTTPTHPPFKDNFTALPQNFSPRLSMDLKPHQPATAKVETTPAFNFGDPVQRSTSAPPSVNNIPFPSTNPELATAQLQKSDMPHSGPASPMASQGALIPLPAAKGHPPKDKFEPKSKIWADTLSRGLVNLNISGPKANPTADIGIDFDDINRKDKRREKSSVAPVTSPVIMGKAMGAGSGIGRAGASGIMPPPNPMMGSGMGMGMGNGGSMNMNGAMGMGMSMGSGVAMGMGRGMGMGMGNASSMSMGGYGGGMNQSMGMNMGMGMGMGQGAQMFPASGLPPGMQGGYNTMMGMGGGYASQQPYGGHR